MLAEEDCDGVEPDVVCFHVDVDVDDVDAAPVDALADAVRLMLIWRWRLFLLPLLDNLVKKFP